MAHSQLVASFVLVVLFCGASSASSHGKGPRALLQSVCPSPGSPNPCYNADGSKYICCAGSCPSIPGQDPYCAGGPPGLSPEAKLEALGINAVNRNGPYIGIVVPNPFEIVSLLTSSTFTETQEISVNARIFHVGSIDGKKVVVVQCGLTHVNAALTTQLLIDYFYVDKILHYGIAGGADESSNLGDVSIASEWATWGLWSWQRDGLTPDDPLPLEAFGDYTREIGRLAFGNYSATGPMTPNSLNSVWLQRQELFKLPDAETRVQTLFFPADAGLLSIAGSLANLQLDDCSNMTARTGCLSKQPKIVIGARGVDAEIFVDNAAIRDFIGATLGAPGKPVLTIDMESSAVAMVATSNGIPFIIFRSVSDLAGGGAQENEAGNFFGLASGNAYKVLTALIAGISGYDA
ncbi:hypothetical protein KFL_003100040 [Klebsormidium nitens]|uniref:Nucleoside phosphorylase domain-containing protein n=1 Tax=Klebsormidium nitens TaxID=105231 RepID=A0A1Y1IDH7_KLENI|nr:hypothetical protein KFL_003100040 [Klebsormidium nitens]|eukprot:GAQ86767.1 hypothetical protein KFL_003100040 [Klebsormidium nitens]